MDIKYMEYVLALAKAGNITQAAKDLYISQPTLSQFIRNYQNTLGIHLFKRMNGRYTLTSAGETFCKYAEQIIELEKNMEQAMQTYKNTTILKIGTSTTKAISMVTHLIPIYRKEFPNIDIAMSEGNSFTIISKVLNNDLDLVFGSISSLDLYKGQILPLKEEKIALAVPSRMSICNSNYNYIQSLDLETFARELSGAPFILQHPGSCIRYLADGLFRSAHMTPVVILNTSNASSIVKSVSSGIGAGFIPVSNMVLDPNIVYFLFTPSLYRIHCMVYRKKIEKDTAFQRVPGIRRSLDRYGPGNRRSGSLCLIFLLNNTKIALKSITERDLSKIPPLLFIELFISVFSIILPSQQP